MTYYRYSPYPCYPPQPKRNYWKWWLTLVVAVVIGAMILVAVGLHSTVTTTTSPTSSAPTVSTSSQWLDAVCKPGEVIQGGGNGKWLTGADGGHDSCGASQGHGWIYAGQYSSESLARHDARIMQITGSTAMVPDTGGYMLFTNPTDPTGVSLEPLTQFGFTITTRQGYSPDIGW